MLHRGVGIEFSRGRRFSSRSFSISERNFSFVRTLAALDGFSWGLAGTPAFSVKYGVLQAPLLLVDNTFGYEDDLATSAPRVTFHAFSTP